MAELTADATESARILSVDTQGTVGVGYRIGDEQVVLLGQNKPVSTAAWTWTVERAQNGTTAAEHDSGATVAPLVDVVGTAAFSTPGSGVEAHGELSGVTANQHHAQVHAADHAAGEADALSLADLGVSAFAETLLDDADAAAARATLGVEELAYVEITSPVSITATSDATQDSIVSAGAVAFDGTAVWIEFQATDVDAQATSGAYTVFGLWDGSTHLGNIALFQNNAGASPAIPVQAKRRLTPSAGSHTYSIRAHTSAGTATVQVGAGGVATRMPGFIRIVRA